MASIHEGNYHECLERLLASVEHAGNLSLINDYLAEKQANGIKPATLANNAVCLRDLSCFLGKDLNDVNKQDVIAFVNHRTRTRHWHHKRSDGSIVESTKEIRLSDSTMASRKQMLRTFYKWLQGDGETYPPNVSWLKASRPMADRIPVDALITNDDLEALITTSPHPRDKAMLAVLYESGLRAGELCALKIGNVERDEYGFRILLPKKAADLKTGARNVRLYHEESGAYLFAWLEVHPDRDNRDAPLFPSASRRNPGKHMDGQALYGFVKAAQQRAGLTKPLRPHLFRHTAATQRASLGWTEAELRAFFGWTRGSDMPATYVHLAGKDYEEMDLKRRGLIDKVERNKSALALRLCGICGTPNLAIAMYCQNCRRPVSPDAEADEARRTQSAVAMMVEHELRRLLTEETPTS